MPEGGDRYTYDGPAGLGEALVGAPLSAEMAELDMHPGTPVVLREVDEDGTVHLEWSDRSGNPRATSVDQAQLAEHFCPQES